MSQALPLGDAARAAGALLALLALGAPAGAAFGRRGRWELGLAVLPVAGSLALVLPLIAAAWGAGDLSGWVWESALAALALGAATAGALAGPQEAAPRRASTTGVGLLSAGVLAVAAAYVVSLGAVLAAGWPSFGWDGLAIWLLRAKVIAASHAFPSDFFHEAQLRQSHWDYPLLLPAWLAWFERLGALPLHRLSLALGLAAAAFPVATAFGLLRQVAAPVAAAVALSPFVVPELLDYHFRGYADALLAMLALAGLSWSAAGAVRWDRASLVAGGLALAAAVAVKNEGILWLCASAVGVLLLSAHHALPARLWAAGLARALLPGLLLFVAWRLTCAHLQVEGTLVSELRWDLVGARLGTVLAAMAAHLFTPEMGPLLVAGVAAMLLLAGGTLGDRLVVTAVLLAAPATFVAGLVVVYLSTPHEVGWHIQTSLHRTVYPLGPVVLALAALAAPLSRSHQPEGGSTIGSGRRPTPRPVASNPSR